MDHEEAEYHDDGQGGDEHLAEPAHRYENRSGQQQGPTAKPEQTFVTIHHYHQYDLHNSFIK